MKYKFLLITLIVLFCSDNHIVQRAAEDYFPLREDSWWRYASDSDTVYVEVEPADTILQIECFPVSYNGVVRYLAKSDQGVSQYIRKIYNYAGNDHTVIESFVVRLELPFMKDNSYQYFLSDSIYVASQLVRAYYEVNVTVVDYTYDSDYGDVYEVDVMTIESLLAPATFLIDTTEVTEYYAPGIGMVRFIDDTIEYRLIDYNIP
jgi:hypothetical protein